MGQNLTASINNPFNYLEPNYKKVQSLSNTQRTSLPDIYYIILDGYGSNEMLNEIYNFDNSDFELRLEKMGFYIIKKSKSNYNRTMLSVSSSLNMDYQDQLLTIYKEDGTEFLQKAMDNNQVFSLLKQRGYSTVAVESGIGSLKIHSVDQVFMPSYAFPNTIEWIFLDNSILGFINPKYYENGFLINPRQVLYLNHNNEILEAFDHIEKTVSINSPKIVFAHILSPHPPFVFNKDGSFLSPPHPFALSDGIKFPGTINEYQKGYASQTLFLNTKVIRLIQFILQNSENPPVIIIQGDHGPRSQINLNDFPDLDYESISNSCIPENISIMNAVFIPNQNYSNFYSTLTPVNTFRTLFNTIYHSNYEILPEQSYFSPQFNISKITNPESRANCFLEK